MIEITNYPKAVTEGLDEYIRLLADRESEERDKLTKRYTGLDDKEETPTTLDGYFVKNNTNFK
jgi:hypothetical protein